MLIKTKKATIRDFSHAVVHIRIGDILPPPSLKLRGGGFSVKNTSVFRLPELIGFPVPAGHFAPGHLDFVVFITEALFSVLLFSDKSRFAQET